MRLLCAVALGALLAPNASQAQWCAIPNDLPGGRPSLNTRILHVGTYKLWGGAITNITPDRPVCTNIVNNGVLPNGDPGRQIQTAWYNGETSPPECWPCDASCNFIWNPTQAGCPCSPPAFYSNCYEFTQTPGSLLHSASQIYNWDNQDGRSNIHVFQDVRVPKANQIQIDYTVKNMETNPAFTIVGEQAFPIAFLQPVLDHAWVYRGGAPWTGAPAEELNIPNDTHQEIDTNTEPWVAWIADDGYGLAMYAPSGWLHTRFSLSRQIHTDKNSTDTNLENNLVNLTLPPNAQASQRVHFVYGSIDTIRATVYQDEGHAWFQDVGVGSTYENYIYRLFRNFVTSGCTVSPPNFCPDNTHTRQEMAVFLLTSRNAPGYLPPACTTTPYPDVPVSSGYCRWIKAAKDQGIMTGCTVDQACAPGCTSAQFCPTSPVKRGSMARFLLKAKEGGGYNPPPPQNPPVFGDVPNSHPNAAYIEELARRGITGGCGSGNYCPNDDIKRAQMAVFISLMFGLY